MRLYSADITGSLVVSGSLIVTGSTAANPTIINPGGDDLEGKVFIVTGSAAITRDLTVGDDFTVKDETKLEKEVKIGYQSGETNYGVEYQLNVTASQGSSYSANFDGDLLITGSLVDKDNATGTAGQVLSSTGTQLQWVVNDGAGITGTGTVGNIPKFTASTVLGNSIIAEAASAITISGDVKINTAGSGTSKLQVVGGIRNWNSALTLSSRLETDGLYFSGAQDAYIVSIQALNFYAGNALKMSISSLGVATFSGNLIANGNVGIGSSPIASPNSADTSLSVYAAQDSSIILGDNVETWEIYQNDDLFFTYGSSPTTVLTLKRTTGNIGIGTTSPAELLEVKASSSPAIQINQNDQYKSIIRLAGNDLEIRGSSGAMEFYNGSADGDSSALRMSISSAGDVTIGSTNDPYLYMISTGGNGNNQRFRMYGYADGGTYGGGFKIDTRNSSNIFNNALTISSGGTVVVNNTFQVLGNNSAYSTHHLTTAAANVAKYNMYDASGNLINTFSAGGDSYIKGGNFGIGLGSDGATLFINGDLKTRLDSTYQMGLHNRYISTYITSTQLGRTGSTSVSNIELLYDIAGAESFEIRRNYFNSKIIFTRNTTGTIAGPYATDLTIENGGVVDVAGTLESGGNQRFGGGPAHGNSSSPGITTKANGTAGVYWNSNGSGGWGGGTFTTNNSDRNMKTNIIPMDINALNVIGSLETKYFNWTEKSNRGDTTIRQAGIIAQDLKELMPEGVFGTEWDDEDKDTNGLSLNSNATTALFIKAIQEQQTIIESQKSLIDGLTARIETLEG